MPDFSMYFAPLSVFRRTARRATSSGSASELDVGWWSAGGGYQSIAALGATYIPWAAWSARNFKDEGFEHSSSGNSITEAAIKNGMKDTAQKLFERTLPHAVDMFGANDSPNLRKYLELGIKTIGNREVRLAWFAHVKADADAMGLQMPDNPLKGHRGDYSE